MPGLIQSLLAPARRDADDVAAADRGKHYWGVLTEQPTRSGVNVTEEGSVKNTAVLAALQIIAGTVGSLPLVLYRRLPGDRRERATDHPLYSILHDEPNTRMTSTIWRETAQAQICTWGNAYGEIKLTNGRQRVVSINPIHPSRVTPVSGKGSAGIMYEIKNTHGQVARIIPSSRMLHVPGLGFNGLEGFSPIRMARDAIGLGLAAEAFGGAFFGQGAQPGGALEHPGTLSDKAFEHLKTSVLKGKHTGLANAHKPLILEEGMKWSQMSIPPEDAQFLQSRQFQVVEVARIFNLPPHVLRDLSKSSFNNIEQENLFLVVLSLRPWFVKWEQEISRKLLRPMGMSDYYVEFLLDALLRGDIKTRYDSYRIARQWGWMCADDIRRLENMDPLPDGAGAVYWAPSNMVPADQLGQPKAAAAAPSRDDGDPDARREEIQRIYGEILARSCEPAIRRELNAGRTAARRLDDTADIDAWHAWSEGFYPQQIEYLARAIAPAVNGYMRDLKMNGIRRTVTLGLATALADYLVTESRERLDRIAEGHVGNGCAEVFEREFASWETKSTEVARAILIKCDMEAE